MKSIFKKSCRKGAFFSFDALIALSILLIAFSIIIGISPPKTFQTSEYQQIHYLADDAMQVFANTKFSSINETTRNEIMSNTNISNEDLNKSLVDIIGLLWSFNQTGYAANITNDFFGSLFPGLNYSIMVAESGNASLIYSSSGDLSSQQKRKYHTSVFRLVSGYKENSPVTGFVARAFAVGAAKKTQSYAYFGGFEGSGNITKMLELPSIIGTINETYMELDTSSNFTLYINNNYSGAYNFSGAQQLYAKNWTVPQQYYSNLVPGKNNITLAFKDIGSGYVGGGFIRVKYNTTIMDTTNVKINADGNATGKYYFPGIDGLINIYSSFYVPGSLKSLGIQFNYLSDYAVYLIIGNVSVYENSSNTTKTIFLNNSFLSSILDYSKFNQTMPIRFGTESISGSSEGSDVVLITDLSGSMGACDVNASSVPDCSGSPGIQHERLDVAKDSDKQFIEVILQNIGQKVGLISYASSTITSKTVYLTDDNSALINMIDSYTDGGCTCVSCGIQSSIDMLATTINTTTIIENKSVWYYNDSFLSEDPPDDSMGRNWTHQNYSLGTLWSSGNAVFGNGTHSIPIITGISSSDGNGRKYAELWDMAADKTTHEIDFSSGMNYTANTFGIGAGNDGWDWGAQYDYDNGNIVYGQSVNGKIVFSTASGTPSQNRCSGYDCSGGYGIEINITPEQYSLISSNGDAYLSLDYEWNATFSVFETSDELWIKGRWTSPFSGEHYLGEELSSSGWDGTVEIANQDNPEDDLAGKFVQNITSWIEGPGTYYLDFGGKLRASASNEHGNFSFDNILLEIANTTHSFYFRKNFTINNLNSIGKGIVRILSDDSGEVYINNILVLNNTESTHNAEYWNSAEIVYRKYLKEGENIVAVKVYNKMNPLRFDLSLIAVNDSRNKAMLVMSDGEANTIIGGGGCSAPVAVASKDAIDRACNAFENYGIVSHTVGFGNDVDATMLQAIADCSNGNYYGSNNADELEQIYADIANSIISYATQIAEISGEFSIAKLYSGSFIEYNYTPELNETYGNISLTLESNTFGNTSGNYSVESPKNGSYYISSNMAVIDVKTTSYSSDYWTHKVEARSESTGWQTAFNLSKFGNNYLSIGDPYIINIPLSFVTPGELNYVRTDTAANSTDPKGGSPQNRIIYSVKVKGTVEYGNTFPTLAEANADAIQRLSDYLESFGISLTDVTTGSQDIGKIPWMWGPAIMTLEVWKS